MSPKPGSAFKSPLPLLLLTMLFLNSCADRIKTSLITYKALDENLQLSNKIIDNTTQSLLKDLEYKSTDIRTHEKGLFWLDKARDVQKITAKAYQYFEGLKSELKQEASLKLTEGKETFKEGDKNAVFRFFTKKRKGQEIHTFFKNYTQEIISVSGAIDSSFHDSLVLAGRTFDTTKSEEDFTKTYFNDLPVVAALASLTKVQNNLKINENRIINFCLDHVASLDGSDTYSTYLPFASINSSYVAPGAEIEIISGIGAFSQAALPRIQIDNKEFSVGTDGVVRYKFKADQKTGKHNIPVRISYIDQEGNRQTAVKNLEYTIASH